MSLSFPPIQHESQYTARYQKQEQKRPVVSGSQFLREADPRKVAVAGGLGLAVLGAALHSSFAPPPPVLSSGQKLFGFAAVPTVVLGAFAAVRHWIQSAAESTHQKDVSNMVAEAKDELLGEIAGGTENNVKWLAAIAQQARDAAEETAAASTQTVNSMAGAVTQGAKKGGWFSGWFTSKSGRNTLKKGASALPPSLLNLTPPANIPQTLADFNSQKQDFSVAMSQYAQQQLANYPLAGHGRPSLDIQWN